MWYLIIILYCWGTDHDTHMIPLPTKEACIELASDMSQEMILSESIYLKSICQETPDIEKAMEECRSLGSSSSGTDYN